MNRKSFWRISAALIVLCVAGCGGRGRVVVTITGPNSVVAGTAAQYSATTTHDPNDKGVTWTCTTTGATACSSANFNPTATASGANTTFTAPNAVESVTITATSVANDKDSASVTVSVVNAASAFAGTFVYTAEGEDILSFYALVGVVTINSSGTVTGGVQDFNDGFGITSLQPGGDTITGGSLAVDATTGQGTLTIVTNNAKVGVNGTETLGVQFVNNHHAQIIQFDSSGTSSGSMDLQTQTTLPTGSFAFSFAGFDPGGFSLVAGGVFTFSGTNTMGTIDVNDGGAVVTGTAFNQTFGSPDASGRGSLTISTAPFTDVVFNYYVVGPEVIRFIDVDAAGQLGVGSGDIGSGSAFGQGDSAGSFSNSSIGQSTITLSGLPVLEPLVLVGQITPGGVAAVVKPAVLATKRPDGAVFVNYTGVVDVNEDGTVLAPSALFTGTFTVATDGRGSLTIPAGDAEDVSNVGVYLIDPHLNPTDPNNPSTATLSSALLVDLDNSSANVISTGVLVPQTDTLTADFTGSYGLGGQIIFLSDGNEADFVGQGNVTSLALSGSVLLNDLFGDATGTAQQTTVTLTGTFAPDAVNVNAGRYTTTLVAALAGKTTDLKVAAYQASGKQLFWIEEDTGSMFMGQFQQQNLPAAAAVKAAVADKKPKQ